MNATRILCRRFGHNRIAAARSLVSAPQRVRPPPRPTQRFIRRRHFADDIIPIAFVDSRDGQTYAIEAEVGKTVLDAALDNEVDIEAACGGELACSTCHLILEQHVYDAHYLSPLAWKDQAARRHLRGTSGPPPGHLREGTLY